MGYSNYSPPPHKDAWYINKIYRERIIKKIQQYGKKMSKKHKSLKRFIQIKQLTNESKKKKRKKKAEIDMFLSPENLITHWMKAFIVDPDL